MELNARNIKSFHKHFEDRIELILESRPIFVSEPENSPWEHYREGETVNFLLKPKNFNNAGRLFSKRGSSMFAFKLPKQPIGPIFNIWAAWYEKWDVVSKSARTQMFAPSSFNWVFFNVGEEPEQQTQLFRAEWVESMPGEIIPQPHWHIDQDVIISHFDDNDNSGGPEDGPLIISLSRLHLGMCGKIATCNSRNSLSEFWQHPVEDTTEIIEWAARTLELAIDQIDYLRVSSIIPPP